jgi:hypothetical protein
MSDEQQLIRRYGVETEQWRNMKFSVTGLALLVMGAFPSAIYAQAPPGQPYVQIPIPYLAPGVPPAAPPPRPEWRERDHEWWEHCDHLRHQEHELRERLAYTPPYSEERERLEHRLREVYHERERCPER